MTEPTLVAWILYDATTDVKYIKMDPSDGSLAIFDSEEAAMSAKRLNSGTDYERCEYYSAPQSAPEVAKLVDAPVKPKTHTVQGVEVPDFRIEPKKGERYWYPTPASVLLCAQQVFRGNEFDIYRKENNLCYEDSVSGKQAAILHSKAWLGGEL